jgi:hypothetical protein
VLRITGERQATVVTIAPEDEHDLPNSFYRRATEEAGRFFGELELVPHWSDFTAHAPEQYELVASKAPSGRRARSATRKKGLLDYFFKR